MDKLKIEKGKKYKTIGGWEAECVYSNGQYVYFIHSTPSDVVIAKDFRISGDDVVGPVTHTLDGRAVSAFSVNEPPAFHGHPADIIEEIK